MTLVMNIPACRAKLLLRSEGTGGGPLVPMIMMRIAPMLDLAPYFPPVMSDVVIDLYHGDKVSVDFSAIKSAGVAAVVLKATQSTGFADPTFAPRLALARDAG